MRLDDLGPGGRSHEHIGDAADGGDGVVGVEGFAGEHQVGAQA